jgi:hypothetical protein
VNLASKGLGGSPRGTSAYKAPALRDVSDCVLARGSAWEGVGKVRPKKTRRALNPRWWGSAPGTTPNRAGTSADTGHTRYTVVNYLRRGRGWGFSPRGHSDPSSVKKRPSGVESPGQAPRCLYAFRRRFPFRLFLSCLTLGPSPVQAALGVPLPNAYIRTAIFNLRSGCTVFW